MDNLQYHYPTVTIPYNHTTCKEAIYMGEKGQLKQNGVHLKEHEYSTVKLFLNRGYDIELIPASQIKGMQTPDIIMLNKPWEMKSPTGCGKTTIRHTIQNAGHQSRNVIIDLRRCKLDRNTAIKEIEIYFKEFKRIRFLKVIVDDEIIVDYIKN